MGFFDTSSATTSKSTGISNGLQNVSGTSISSTPLDLYKSNIGGITFTTTDHGALALSDEQLGRAMDAAIGVGNAGLSFAADMVRANSNASMTFANDAIVANTDLIRDAGAAVLNYSREHVDKVIDAATGIGNGSLTFAADQIDRNTDLLTRAGNAVLRYSSEQGQRVDDIASQAIDTARAASNGVMVFADEQTDRVDSMSRLAVDTARAASNGVMLFADDQVRRGMDIANGALVFGGEQLDKVVNAANGALVFGSEQMDRVMNATNGALVFGSEQVGRAMDAANGALVFGSEQSARVDAISRMAVDTARAASNGIMVFADDQIRANMDLVRDGSNAAYSFADDQTRMTIDAVRASANGALVFAAERDARLFAGLDHLLDANYAQQELTSNLLASSHGKTLDIVSQANDDAMTFVGQGMSAALATSRAAVGDISAIAARTTEGIGQFAGAVLEDLTGSYNAGRVDLMNFSGGILSQLGSQANANIKAVSDATRSDAANSLDKVVMVAGIAIAVIGLAAVFARKFA